MSAQPFFFPRTQSLVEALATPTPLAKLGPIAGRFVRALRLIAFCERIKRDPVPDLATKLASVDVAARALILAEAIAAAWPERVVVKRSCCRYMSHDEATIGAFVDAAAAGNRRGFEAALDGLVRPDRAHRLWEAALALVAAELRAA